MKKDDGEEEEDMSGDILVAQLKPATISSLNVKGKKRS